MLSTASRRRLLYEPFVYHTYATCIYLTNRQLYDLKLALQAQTLTVARSIQHPYRVLLSLTGIALLIQYVETMILPGIPTIQNDFSITSSLASWITSIVLIVGSAASPILGKLGDNYGKKRILLVALAVYTFGVGIAGFSPNIYFLLLARAFQGVGFAMFPLALAIMTDVFPKEKLAGAQGLISGTALIGGAAGLVIGSYVVQNLGWQSAFYSAFVLSIILFGIVAKLVHVDIPKAKAAIDYLGASFLTAGIVGFLVYLTEGPTLGWFSPEELGLLAFGIALSVLFFWFERRRLNPLIPLSLLRLRNVLVANLIGIISGAAMFIAFFAVIYYSELPPPFGLGQSISSTGLILAPATLTTIPVAILIGRIMPKTGPRPILVIGALVAILGFALFGLNRATTLDITIDIIATFAGAISVVIPIVNMISSALTEETKAVGLGMNQMLRNLGSAIGPVLATTVMTSYTISVGKLSLPSATAFNTIFEISIGLMIMIAAIALATKNYVFRSTTPKSDVETASGP